MNRKLLQDCPVCGSALKVRVLHCSSCSTNIEGTFEPPQSKIFYLNKKDLEFVELFVKVRGSIKEMEKALGVSYPTVRGMLNGVIERMGYSSKPEMDTKEKNKILDQLERGEISATEAANLLKQETVEI